MIYTEFEFNDYEQHLMEELEGQKAQRAEFIKKTYGDKWPKQGLPGYEDIDDFIDKLAAVDPSRNGMYMPWLAKLAITKPNENKTEDLDRVGSDLGNFETFKRQIERKDINQYKSFQDLYDVIAPFLRPRKPTKDDKAKAELEKVKKDIITVYAGPEGWIRIPTTREAAIFLGQNTRWCTSARGNNMFDHYNRDDSLFVVYDKETKERSQLHIESGQFAGEDDRNKGVHTVPTWARGPIVDWYKANVPNLTPNQVFSLARYAGYDTELVKDTPHDEVMALMKKYNILGL